MEDVISASSQEDWSIYDTLSATVRVNCLPDQDLQLLLEQGYTITQQTTWLPYNPSFVDGTPWDGQITNEALVSEKCIYEFNPQAINDLSYFLERNFNASITTDGDVFGGPSISQVFYNASNINFNSVRTHPLSRTLYSQ
jgi:hypothetical protein